MRHRREDLRHRNETVLCLRQLTQDIPYHEIPFTPEVWQGLRSAKAFLCLARISRAALGGREKCWKRDRELNTF